ncbi:proteasome assembly chaperone family protein [Haloferax sp. DFSO60]|uniref:proteasome assembly chaperone family protein n=1 Tax=Haloferax sp. DFSO60 TaxID=3388652 RepID=UPI003978AE81
MAHIRVLDPDVSEQLSSPTMVEGFPGVGLVGKIAADHLIETFDMVHYGDVHCTGVPHVAVYLTGDSELHSPVRLYADPDHDLLVLQSDVPVRPDAATDIATCLATWFEDFDVTPIFLSGISAESVDDDRALFGVGTGDATKRLADAGIDVPDEAGLISGPTGALLSHAVESGLSSLGLIVESYQQFPDPEAARIVIQRGIEPLTGIDVPVDELVDHAAEIRQAKEQLAKQLQQSKEDSTQARPLRMYQ